MQMRFGPEHEGQEEVYDVSNDNNTDESFDDG